MKGRRPDTSKLRVVLKNLFPKNIETGHIVVHEDSKGAFDVYHVSDNFVVLSGFLGNKEEPVFQSDKKYETGEITVRAK